MKRRAGDKVPNEPLVVVLHDVRCKVRREYFESRLDFFFALLLSEKQNLCLVQIHSEAHFNFSIVANHTAVAQLRLVDRWRSVANSFTVEPAFGYNNRIRIC